MFKQPAGPFANTSFHGPFAFTLSGSSQGSGGTLVVYILDSDQALILESDSTRVLTGVLVRQY